MAKLINGTLMVSSREISTTLKFTHDKCFNSISSQVLRNESFRKHVVIRPYPSPYSPYVEEAFVSLEGLKWILSHGSLFTARKWLGISGIIKDVFEEDYPKDSYSEEKDTLVKMCVNHVATIKNLQDEVKVLKAGSCTLQIRLTEASTHLHKALHENMMLKGTLQRINGLSKGDVK